MKGLEKFFVHLNTSYSTRYFLGGMSNFFSVHVTFPQLSSTHLSFLWFSHTCCPTNPLLQHMKTLKQSYSVVEVETHLDSTKSLLQGMSKKLPQLYYFCLCTNNKKLFKCSRDEKHQSPWHFSHVLAHMGHCNLIRHQKKITAGR